MASWEEMASVATTYTDDEMYEWAQDVMARHYPENQGHGYPDRCSQCHYTRHPCDPFDMAAWVITKLGVRDE